MIAVMYKKALSHVLRSTKLTEFQFFFLDYQGHIFTKRELRSDCMDLQADQSFIFCACSKFPFHVALTKFGIKNLLW